MGMIVIVGESRAETLLDGFSVIKAPSCDIIDCGGAAVILGAHARAEIRAALGVIVDGDEPADDLPRFVQLISCGISPKNTVSVTSRTPEKITLSLNRSIRTHSGVCEPLELPVPAAAGVSEYDLMAAFAVELLLK
ncbi:MAG: hypothetical protein K2J80_04650 [Oscillospiraceae bacterium]|nr:hypothetical protein [Oscillospiraceae bacterium]